MMRLAAIAVLPLVLMAFEPQPPESEEPHSLSAAEKRDLSKATMTAITGQLIDRGCWTDHRDLPEAPRLSAILRIYIGPDGHLLNTPQLVQPSSEPTGDRPLQAFIGLAREALKTCDVEGFDLPSGAAELLTDNYIDIMFLPRFGRDD